MTITLLTHDSFDVTKSVLRDFEDRTGITVKVVPVGDAGQLANRLILASGNPEGDVAFGVDNDQLAELFAKDVFVPYASAGLGDVAPDLLLDDQHRVTPVDHGEVCVNIDTRRYVGGTPVPSSLDDLADPAFRDQLVVENPATSTPGLAFLLATVAAYGDPGFEDYWRRLRDNGVTVVDGWEQAYFGEFSGAGGGEGTHPMVVSYATSPVAEVVFADPPITSPADQGPDRHLLPADRIRRDPARHRARGGGPAGHRFPSIAAVPGGHPAADVRLPGIDDGDPAGGVPP